MLKTLVRKIILPLSGFLIYVVILYSQGFNDLSLLPYINLVMYFVLYLVVQQSSKNTNLNKNVVILYSILFFYLALFSTIPILFRHIDPWNFIIYVYYEIILKFLILWLSIAITLSSFKKFVTEDRLLWVFSALLALIAIFINYFDFIINPFLLVEESQMSQWQVRNYVAMVVTILSLVLFWYRYYVKLCVVSEYLDIIFFLFTISNSIEALHFVMYQHNFNVFINGQIISLVINNLLLLFWVRRYLYLHSKIAKENERFLENYYFLGGLVAKPYPNWYAQMLDFVSVKVVAVVLVIVGIGIVSLFLVKQITFYLFVNTIFLVLAIVLALFFGLTRIRRQWNSTFGRLINKK